MSGCGSLIAKSRKRGHPFFWLAFFLFLNVTGLQANTYYEGTYTFNGFGKIDLHWMTQFLPYNPIIVNVGAYCGEDTCLAAKHWPNCKVYALEPNPRAYSLLKRAVAGQKLDNVKTYNLALNNYNGTATLHLCYGPQANDLSYESMSSLLPPSAEMENTWKGSEIDVPCMKLDDWCQENQIDHIDILKLELEGAELQVLESSPNILKNVKMIWLQTFFHPFRKDMTFYFNLKDYLLRSNFVVLAHWYKQGERGNAVYISQELFDAYFVKCLGLGLGGIAYP